MDEDKRWELMFRQQMEREAEMEKERQKEQMKEEIEKLKMMVKIKEIKA